MDNTTTIAYSAEAVESLVDLERKHGLSIKGARRECDNCMINKHGKPVIEKDIIRWSGADYPCPTLTLARSMASEETLVAVALILGGQSSE